MELYQLDNDAFKKMCVLENANYTYTALRTLLQKCLTINLVLLLNDSSRECFSFAQIVTLNNYFPFNACRYWFQTGALLPVGAYFQSLYAFVQAIKFLYYYFVK